MGELDNRGLHYMPYTYDGHMHAVDAATGKQKWTGKLPAGSARLMESIPPAVGQDATIVYAMGNDLVPTEVTSAVQSSPLYPKESVYAWNATTGTKLWSYALAGVSRTPPVVFTTPGNTTSTPQTVLVRTRNYTHRLDGAGVTRIAASEQWLFSIQDCLTVDDPAAVPVCQASCLAGQEPNAFTNATADLEACNDCKYGYFQKGGAGTGTGGGIDGENDGGQMIRCLPCQAGKTSVQTDCVQCKDPGRRQIHPYDKNLYIYTYIQTPLPCSFVYFSLM